MPTSDRLIIRLVAGACLALQLAAAGAAPPEAFVTALKRDQAGEVRTWLLRGADPNDPDPQDGPPIIIAVKARATAALKALLESPETDVNALNKDGENAMMRATLLGDIDTVKLLIARKADVNKPGWTPLHYAASSGQVEIAQLLLDNDAYIDAQSPNNTTPLMMASRHNFRTLARMLVEQGADPSQRNDAGLSAADYFRRSGDPETADWMKARADEFEAKYGTIKAPKIPASRQPGASN